jgi:hypothetical protein
MTTIIACLASAMLGACLGLVVAALCWSARSEEDD